MISEYEAREKFVIETWFRADALVKGDDKNGKNEYKSEDEPNYLKVLRNNKYLFTDNQKKNSIREKDFSKKSERIERDEVQIRAKEEERAKGMRARCPDLRCLEDFEQPWEIFSHIMEKHSLRCSVTYCTFSTFEFEEFIKHFKSCHCFDVILPMKRNVE